MTPLQQLYPKAECPDCNEPIPDHLVEGSNCEECGWKLIKTTPHDYYFMYSNENDEFWFVSKEYWAENECCNDSGHGDFDELLPIDETSCFTNSSEWSWEYIQRGTGKTLPADEARQKLIAVGFEEIANPWN